MKILNNKIIRTGVMITGLTVFSIGVQGVEAHTIKPVPQNVVGIWRLVEYHDFHADGNEHESMGSNARGVFIHSPDGHLSPHIVPTEPCKSVSRNSNHQALAETYKPYIGYFGTYSVDYAAMTITHHIEGAKLPSREGRSELRPFYFKDGDLVLDFKSASGMRFCHRLKR